jgi:hypothetical protein
VLDCFTETTIDDKTRKHTLALELARLDDLQETFYARALEGDVACHRNRSQRARHRGSEWGPMVSDAGSSRPRSSRPMIDRGLRNSGVKDGAPGWKRFEYPTNYCAINAVLLATSAHLAVSTYQSASPAM